LKLILVRHGETYWNEGKRVQGGDSDIELNETGLAQARKLAAFLKNENIVAILSSPMRRATATAEPLARHHGLPVEVDQGLTEIRVGALEGMSISNLGTTFSRFLMERWQETGATRPVDGETLVEVQQRAWEAVERLLDRYKTNPGPNEESAVVVVSHFFVTLAIILKALNLPPDSFTKFKVDLGGVSILEFTDYGPRLLTFNVTPYQC
jgi:broad specificity phosphatase PhoE